MVFCLGKWTKIKIVQVEYLKKQVAANKMYSDVPVADISFQLPNSSVQMLEYISTPIKFFNLRDIVEGGPEIYGDVVMLSGWSQQVANNKNNKGYLEAIYLDLAGICIDVISQEISLRGL